MQQKNCPTSLLSVPAIVSRRHHHHHHHRCRCLARASRLMFCVLILNDRFCAYVDVCCEHKYDCCLPFYILKIFFICHKKQRRFLEARVQPTEEMIALAVGIVSHDQMLAHSTQNMFCECTRARSHNIFSLSLVHIKKKMVRKMRNEEKFKEQTNGQEESNDRRKSRRGTHFTRRQFQQRFSFIWNLDANGFTFGLNKVENKEKKKSSFYTYIFHLFFSCFLFFIFFFSHRRNTICGHWSSLWIQNCFW